MEKRKFYPAAAFLVISSLISCVTEPVFEKDPMTSDELGPYKSVQDQLVEAAYWAEGRNSLTVRGKSFGLDCTGIVLAAYYYAGIDLARDFNKYEGNGVKRLYLYLKKNALIYKNKYPVPGDVIFWNDTWDANENGHADDHLTHVGMIVSMDHKSGQGSYLHYNYARGIAIESINLLDPDNPALNAPIRMRSLPKVNGYRYMSSQLIQDLARAYELERDLVD